MSRISIPREQEEPMVTAAQTNPEGFAPLYEHYYPHIRRYFAVKLKSADVIDDLTAKTFEKALKNIKKFEYKGHPFSAWLYRIAHNHLIDYYRKGSNSVVSLEQQVIDVPEEKRSVDSELKQDWEETTLATFLKKLPEREQTIITLKFYEGYTNRKIAKKLEISESNVGTIIYRAMKKLRQDFSNT